jgi:Tol biopolymer transport system component/CubicO group peptidase (beta-lactamase class C family)
MSSYLRLSNLLTTGIVLLFVACSPTATLPGTPSSNSPIDTEVASPTLTAEPAISVSPTTTAATPALSTSPTPASTPVGGGTGQLSFSSNRRGAYADLYVMNLDGSGVTLLAHGDGNIFAGPWSPDGQKILFTGFGLIHSYVGVMNADGNQPQDLSQSPNSDEGFPAWSPDGGQIAFTSRRDGNNEIYLMNADGSQPRRLTNNPSDDFAPSWSPDGSQIAFVSDRDNPTGVNNLYLMDTNGAIIRRLTNGPEIDYSPAWSPDGSWIAFRAHHDGPGDIYLIRPDGTGLTNLTDNSAQDWAPAWSPDGTLLAFQSDRDGNWEIYRMDKDGSNPHNLTQNPADDQMPYWKPPSTWPTIGWRSATPEEQGMDSEKLSGMVEHIQQEKLNLHSLLIVRNGYLVSEIYVYPYSAGQVHFIASVTKSVMGTLTGIAIQKGYIQDVQQSLFSLLPDQEVVNLDEEKKAITLEDLLTMTSGLDCHENPAPGEAFMQASQNWVQFMLDLPMAAQPGTRFNYCTGAVQVLSAILQKATGMSAREFANQNLFAPLGIGPISEASWPSDPQGLTIGGYGLALTPVEMAKLGYLFLNQGKWDGSTIVPADWVVTSTKIHANQGDENGYGYLWWIDPQGEWYAALGLAGQHIFVYPAENLVVVFTADLPFTNDGDLIPLQELLDQYILPAIESDQPLPANPESLDRLKAGVQALAQPQRTEPTPLPVIAAQISGKAYALAENPFGWQTIAFDFLDRVDEVKVSVDLNGGTGQLAVGLDNVYRTAAGGDSTFPEGLRGRWENDDTLVVEDIFPGQMLQFYFRIQFSGDAIHITRLEKYSGSKVELQGVLKPDEP